MARRRERSPATRALVPRAAGHRQVPGGALAHARNYLRTYQETHTDIKDAPSIVVAQYLDGLYGKAIDYVAHIQDRFLNAPTVATETSLPSNLVTSDELMAARIAKSKGKKHLEEWKR